MTKEEYMLFHKECCDKMVEITRAKNSDYTGLSQNPFQNFLLCEQAQIASVLQGFLVRMSDKLARINSFAQKGTLAVKDETVLDTLLDLANYSILMAGFIKSETTKEMVWGDPEVIIDYGKGAPAPSEFSQRIESKL